MKFPSFPTSADFNAAPLAPETAQQYNLQEPKVNPTSQTTVRRQLTIYLAVLPALYLIFMIYAFASHYGGAYYLVWLLLTGGLNGLEYFAMQRMNAGWMSLFVYINCFFFAIRIIWSIIAIIGLFSLVGFAGALGVSGFWVIFLILTIIIIVCEITFTWLVIKHAITYYDYTVVVRQTVEGQAHIVPTGSLNVQYSKV
ncbi:hypothetical protein BC830DRAFT_1099964 [Chytriomyces sp. MP71]|nr:hypothetical protein BC830DRAFT_1099964 [Chytriomyces sp. MP71]